MSEQQKPKLFREKSLEAVESPESLNDYLRVTSPGVWLVLAAVIALLLGGIFWSIFGRINTTVSVAVVADDAKSGVVIELNCETDFVGMNEKFKGYAENIAKIALAKKLGDAEALKADEEVAALITDCVHVMGENTQLARATYVESTGVCSYIHMGGKIGVLMQFDVEGIDPTAAEFVAYGRDVAMQVAAMSPVAPNREAVPADVVAKEMEIYKAQAAASGKPENIQEKIATGRLEKYYAENCLTEQAFVKDGDITIQQYTDKVAKELGGSIKVVDFVRYALGE